MLGLIAGRGRLPAEIVAAADEQVIVAAMEAFPPDDVAVDLTFRLETLGSLPGRLTDLGVTRLCLAGWIDRPPIDPSAIDAATLPLVPRMMAAIQKGDDAALRTVVEIFEESGLQVVSADTIAPDLLPTAGVLTRKGPSEQEEADARRGAEVAAAIGAGDIGQSCAVLKGQAIALEGLFGTEWMLRSLSARPDAGGGLLYKAPKPGQDRRVDLPVIGPETVPQAKVAGLDGIVIEAGGVMVLSRDETVKAADDAGLFIWVRRP